MHRRLDAVARTGRQVGPTGAAPALEYAAARETSRVEVTVLHEQVTNAAAHPAPHGRPGRASPVGNPIQGDAVGAVFGEDTARIDVAAVVGGQAVDPGVEAGAHRAPGGAIPAGHVVECDRVPTIGGKGAAGIERVALPQQTAHRTVETGADRSPTETSPLGDVTGRRGKVTAHVERAGDRIDRQGINAAIGAVVESRPGRAVPAGEVVQSDSAGAVGQETTAHVDITAGWVNRDCISCTPQPGAQGRPGAAVPHRRKAHHVAHGVEMAVRRQRQVAHAADAADGGPGCCGAVPFGYVTDGLAAHVREVTAEIDVAVCILHQGRHIPIHAGKLKPGIPGARCRAVPGACGRSTAQRRAALGRPSGVDRSRQPASQQQCQDNHHAARPGKAFPSIGFHRLYSLRGPTV